MQLQYVLVVHPTRGKIIILSSDLSLDPLDVIRIYSYRFKIEVTFKSAIYNVGAFLYRFWSPTLDKTRRGTGTTYLHKKGKQYRLTYLNKLRSYEVFVQVAFIAQGILQYISLTQNKVVWSKFGSWIRTIRPNVLPTEMVVAKALRNQYIDFLQGNGKASNLQKFIRKKVQIQKFKDYHMTG